MVGGARARVLLGVTAGVLGCGSPPRPTPPPPRPTEAELLGPLRQSGTVSGRVTLAGRPVQSFGVALANNPMVFSFTRLVDAADGRFTIHGEAGAWTLVVAGPDFERTEVPVVLYSHKLTEPIEIEVSEGVTVSGLVSDDAGRPVAGAQVRISRDLMRRRDAEHPDERIRRLYGIHDTVTDTAGRFSIRHVGIGQRTHVIARVPDRLSSHVTALDDVDPSDLRVTLHPIAHLRGHVRGDLRSLAKPSPFDASVRSHMLAVTLTSTASPSSRFSVDVDERGRYAAADLPAGEYDVELLDLHAMAIRARQRVTLQSGQTTVLDLQSP